MIFRKKILGVAVLIVLNTSCAGVFKRSQSTPETSNRESDTQSTQTQNAETHSAEVTTQGVKKNTEASAEYHFSMAQAYSTEGSSDRAIEEYKLALMYDSKSALVHTRLASEYVKKGMLSAAMETCKEALKVDPKYVDAHLMLGGIYSTSRETEQALREYTEVLRLEPLNDEAAVYKAQILIETHKLPEASKHLQAFLKKAPESVVAWYYLGRSFHRQDLFKEAIKAYQKALDLRPTFTQAGLAMGYYYEEKRQNDKAIQIYKKLYDEAQDIGAANRLATLLLKQERYTEAIPYLESLVARDPEDFNSRVKLGLIQMELKKYDVAVRTFKQILEKNPDSDRIHFYLGSLYQETKQIDLAMIEMRAISSESRLYADAVLHVAYLLKAEKKYNEANTYLAGALEKQPKVAAFYLFKASVEEELGHQKDAVAILEKGAKLFPEDEKIRYYLGSLYDKQGDLDLAIAQMETILTVNPDNVDALNYIGYTYTVRGMRLHDAEKMLKRALVLKPDNAYVKDSWGWYLFVRGRVQEAVIELEKAVKLKPTESTILEHLADVYLKQNLREKAANQYSEALRFADTDTGKQKIQEKLNQVSKELAKRTGSSGGAASTRAPAGHADESKDSQDTDE